MKKKILIFTTHPIQYQVPLFKLLSKNKNLNVKVIYASNHGAINSIDKDGTGQGFDDYLLSKIDKNLKIPLIIHGGAGNINHIIDVVKKGNVDAVALASLLHYNSLNSIKKKFC